ncbi:MAG: Gfo/Idh/MocA family protein, partial [Nitrosopumilaceae archaeon]
IKSAKAGKHIICEKSATASYKSAKKMVQECKKNDVRILEGFSFRFHPQHTKILKIIKENVLGKLFSFYGSYGFTLPYSKENIRFKKELGGGVLNDVGCYLICASRMIFRNNPSSITCNLVINKKIGVDIKGSIHMIYPQNCVAFANFSYNDFFQSMYNIWGANGFASLERAFNIRRDMKASIHLQTTNKTKHVKLKPINQSKLMISEFCNALQQPQLATFDYENDLIDQAKVMEAARQSNSTKKLVYLDAI